VHVDPPGDPKDYLHRAGRTARAGEAGTVVTLVLPHQEREVESMTRKAGVKAVRTRVRPGDSGLHQVTGARRPSGIPLPAIPAGGEATSRYGSARPSSGPRPPRTGSYGRPAAPGRSGGGQPAPGRSSRPR